MPHELPDEPSFSPGRKWRIGLQVCVLTVLVLAVLGMANYLSHFYFKRLHLSSRTRIELSPRTIHFVKSVTNEVKVTVYYDKEDAIYGLLMDLLDEYRLANPKIKVDHVDYLRDPGAAERVKAAYKLSLPTEK